jgi:hypothetical protein
MKPVPVEYVVKIYVFLIIEPHNFKKYSLKQENLVEAFELKLVMHIYASELIALLY